MARLPTVGGDDGNWGQILNEFLSQDHNPDGTLKAADDIANAKAKADTAVQTVNGKSGPTVSLSAGDVGAADDNDVLHLTNDESVWGTKTFNNSPVVPTPVNGIHAANKAYVDSVAGSTPDADATTKGKIQLAGDLSGTADSPTVPGLASKEPAITPGTTSQYLRGDKSWQTLDKAAVGLANADNTSDANKPISTATQTALNSKADDSAVVHNTGNETIAGVKTFSSSPVLPTPTNNTDAANKAYVDSVAGSTPDADATTKGKIQLAGDLSGTADSPTVPGLTSKANASVSITGATSLTGGGDLSANRTLSLVNDSATPGNSKYYGTNDGGTKGYYDLPASGGTSVLLLPTSAATTRSNAYGRLLFTTTAGNTQRTYRVRHVAARDITDVGLVYGNWYGNASLYTQQQLGPNNITVRCSIEVGSGGFRFPLYAANGNRDITIPPGGMAEFTATGLTIPAGTVFYTWTCVSVTNEGEQWPQGVQMLSANNEGYASGDTTLSGSVTTSSGLGFSPIVIIGREHGGAPASIMLTGDSIGAGQGDTPDDQGFLIRALGTSFPLVRTTQANERMSTYLNTVYFRGQLARYASGVICQYGVNDLIQPGMTTSIMQTNFINAWRLWAEEYGLKVTQTTLTPRSTTSTDGYTTTLNQTPAANNTIRGEFNDWIRDGAPITAATMTAATTGASGAGIIRAGDDGHPLVGWHEVAATVETSLNSGIWRVDQGALTADGTHPNAIGHGLMATGINLTLVATLTRPSSSGGNVVYPNGQAATTVGMYSSQVVNVRGEGAVGDGVTDDSAAFVSAMTKAKAAVAAMAQGIALDPRGEVAIEIPPGEYLITQAGALLGSEGMTSKGAGIRIFGYGNDISKLIFKPATASNMVDQRWWQNIQFHNLGFYADTAGCTFFYSDAGSPTSATQRFQFFNCGWFYFNKIMQLGGTNNNSEAFFYACHNYLMEDTGAWLSIPAAGSDQFLNYWFYGCTHWSTDAPFIDAEKGGSFFVYGLDASAWGTSLVSSQQLFKMRGTTHAQGVCNLRVDGLRVEAKNALAGLLYSEWPQGSISFSAVDWSSQTSTYTYGDIITISLGNTDGPSIIFRDSILAGGVNIAFGVNFWQHAANIIFEDCQWRQKVSPSDVVTYDTSGASPNTLSVPAVKFVRCRSAVTSANNVLSANGAPVWDATIGYKGQLLQSLTKRIVSVRGVYGTTNGSTVARVQLPVGAIITGFSALSPAGTTAEGDGGIWTLATTEVSPTTIATVTISGAMSAGFSVSAPMTVPYLCDNAEKALVTITPTNVSTANPGGMLMIEGYW